MRFVISEVWITTLHWRHNEHDGFSDHQPYDYLLTRLFRRRWKKTSKLRVTGLCAQNSPVTGEFPAQRASNTENVSIWWRHHEKNMLKCMLIKRDLLKLHLAGWRLSCQAIKSQFSRCLLINMYFNVEISYQYRTLVAALPTNQNQCKLTWIWIWISFSNPGPCDRRDGIEIDTVYP